MLNLRLRAAHRDRGSVPWRDIALVALIAAWSALALDWFLTPASSLPRWSIDLMLVTAPALLALAWSLREPSAPGVLRYGAIWCSIVTAVVLLTPQLLANQTLAVAVPIVVATTWVVSRRPALGVAILLAITASFGTLAAYFSFPYNRTATVIVAGLVASTLIRLLVQRQRGALPLPLSVVVILTYLFLTVSQVPLAGDRQLALTGFELAPWSMCAMLAVAYSQWPRMTQMRIVHVLSGIALLVGAYATLRFFIGPSSVERALASSTDPSAAYNQVGNKPKLLGSFPNGADLGQWTALMIPFCVSCTYGFRGRTRLACLMALPLLAIALFGSALRTGAVAASVAVLLVVVLHVSARAFTGLRLGSALICAIGLLAVVVGAFAVAGKPATTSNHSFTSFLAGPSQDISLKEHEYKWNEAIGDLAGHPFGYGLGAAYPGFSAPTLAQNPQLYYTPLTRFGVDNGYLKVALDQGFSIMILFGLGLVLLLGTLIRRSTRLEDPDGATIAIGASGVLAALLILEVSSSAADTLPALAAWLAVGLGLAQLGWRHEQA